MPGVLGERGTSREASTKVARRYSWQLPLASAVSCYSEQINTVGRYEYIYCRANQTWR